MFASACKSTADRPCGRDDYLAREAATQAIYITAVKSLIELGKMLNVELPRIKGSGLEEFHAKLVEGARKRFFDASLGCFVSGPSNQVYYLSQAWMVVARVVDSASEARQILMAVKSDPNARQPVSPYGHHYVSIAHAGSQRACLQMWTEMKDTHTHTLCVCCSGSRPCSFRV